MSSTRMKRSASDDCDHNAEVMFLQGNSHARDISQYSNTTLDRFKRSRVGLPPKIVGPLTFDSDGNTLQQALIPAAPSSMPGVYRLASTLPVTIRLWSPQWPNTQFLETTTNSVLQSINQKCIFIFDTRTSTSEQLFSNSVADPELLLKNHIIRQIGVVVSPYAVSDGVIEFLPIPFIQDPSNELARLCRFDSSLGPCAVLVKDNVVVSTLMLQRKQESILETLQTWSSI
ncbi:hypothetical protein DASB73_018980 [Starmerella bacillaris]|uniref:Uncharacterized protein n=1 Tax=Starmerella bacillaris TaxID=1247836 RepID=A0AAV5RHR6_STABA|nr:hypothetical protein DASB73_018980 [Starmerella bacillaris]